MRPLAPADMEGLLILALIAEGGSLSAAARVLGVAPSAVSKRIAALEARLDARLLVRSTRRVALAEAGLRLHDSAAQVLQAWRAANRRDDSEHALVRINSPGLFAQVVLTPFAAQYRDLHPGLTLSLSGDDRMIELATGRFDIVIRIARRLTQASALIRKIGADRLITAASPAYLARFGVPERPDALLRHRCLHYLPRTLAEEWCFAVDGAAMAVPVTPAFEAMEDAVLREAAVAGLGLAVMPRCMLAPDLAAGRLVSVLEAAMWSPAREIHAVIVEGRLAPPAVRRVATDLARVLRAAEAAPSR